ASTPRPAGSRCGSKFQPSPPSCRADRPVSALHPQLLTDRYELERVIGHGGMADVWVATDRRLERAVAVKVMRTGGREDTAARQRFEIEARAAATLNHPNVVTVH